MMTSKTQIPDISTAVANKLLAHLGNIPDELSQAKEFLEATSTKQASTVVQLHETAMQHAAKTANLIEISLKLASTEIPHLPPPSMALYPKLWPTPIPLPL